MSVLARALEAKIQLPTRGSWPGSATASGPALPRACSRAAPRRLWFWVRERGSAFETVSPFQKKTMQAPPPPPPPPPLPPVPARPDRTNCDSAAERKGPGSSGIEQWYVPPCAKLTCCFAIHGSRSKTKRIHAVTRAVVRPVALCAAPSARSWPQGARSAWRDAVETHCLNTCFQEVLGQVAGEVLRLCLFRPSQHLF